MHDFYYKQLADDTYCIIYYKGDEEDLVLPDTFGGRPITVLFDKLFAGHTELRSLHIPDTVTDMGEFLFDGCVNLRELKLPADLKTLWGHTFCRCSMEEIVIPDGVRSLPPFAFKDAKNLKKVVCGSGMKKIYPWVFGGCDDLEEVVYGPDVEVSEEAFMTKIHNT